MDQDFLKFGLAAFVTLLVVVDPPGVVPIFVGLTKDELPARRRAILIRAVVIAFGVALFFLVAGRAVLSYLGVTVHAFVLKTPKGSGMPEIVAENLTQNTGGRYDVMNTSTSLPEKMKALGEKLALDHRNMRNWYEVDIQTDSDVAPIDVAVAREGVRLQISNSRHGK